ncbi:ATPase [Paludibacter sp. 221]|uniref:BadF/BadG/BcrA/BcrD ATPase family protein n=1 Tax=Paludibacter sp. 221 TaxID=2302939 RepID=UPI0013D4FB61|nr:BadF/BadG/BcrA/BcrD ATPase family protein [Paludibacter sp. 221]NDV47598.1 ATPase [Paludibacter sp. 221]
MILVADSGSTKTDWCLVGKNGLVKKASLKGCNPFFRTKEDIRAELKEMLLPEIEGCQIEAIYFYGAGCIAEKIEIVHSAISDIFPNAAIEVGTDLLGAAIGLKGNSAGIVAILGTGSNSCFYDGEGITDNVSPLGFILGDEGSGAALGKLFIGACLKNQLGEDIKNRFLERYGLDVPTILDRVYRQTMPNRFLAGFAPFIKENIETEGVHTLVYNAFSDYFKRNVMQYDYKQHPVSFTGSVAFHFQEILYQCASDLNIKIDKITQSPIQGLINYHTPKV